MRLFDFHGFTTWLILDGKNSTTKMLVSLSILTILRSVTLHSLHPVRCLLTALLTRFLKQCDKSISVFLGTCNETHRVPDMLSRQVRMHLFLWVSRLLDKHRPPTAHLLLFASNYTVVVSASSNFIQLKANFEVN